MPGIVAILCYRQLDHEGDVLQHPEFLQEARPAGRELAATLLRA